MIAPGKRLCGVASPDWGTALVQLPWWLYVYYGNKNALNDFYPNMKQWTDYVSTLASDTARTNKYGKRTKHIIYQGLGDWCPPEGNETIDAPIEFTSTAYHYLDVTIMEQVARILGKNTDAKIFALEKGEIAEEVVKNLYNAQQKTFGSQTADAMALDFGLVPRGDEKAVADAMVRNMNEKYQGFMHCGIFGITRIGSMLARHGYSDAAMDNVYPERGRTALTGCGVLLMPLRFGKYYLSMQKVNRKVILVLTITQCRPGTMLCFMKILPEYAPDDSGYGFKVIRFDPLFTSNLQWAKGSIESPYGTVSSSWKNDEGKLAWQIKIPANSTGLVALPNGKIITVNGKPLSFKKYSSANKNINSTFYRFPSGNFSIQSL